MSDKNTSRANEDPCKTEDLEAEKHGQHQQRQHEQEQHEQEQHEEEQHEDEQQEEMEYWPGSPAPQQQEENKADTTSIEDEKKGG
jgi:hypothetical protein